MKPLLILGVPRSGTSMVAGIFAQHGLWVGTCRPPDGFNQRGHFENLAIKNLMKRWWHGNGHTNDGVIAEPKPGFRTEVERLLAKDGWRGERWMYKCAPVYWKLFAEWNPVWVTVRRNPDSVIRSNKATQFVPEIERVLPAHLAVLDELEANGAAMVDADELIVGRYETLRAALASAGIEMNEQVVRPFICPALWRHG